ncbi:MAG: glycosyltransferase family 2 protein [bacterium]
MKNNFDIAIAYRIYPGVSKVPPVFSDNKFKLSELCLYSFRKSLENLKFKLFALFDNCPDSYVDLFKKYFNDDELEIFRFGGIGNAGTFEQQIEILLNQNYSDYIYFAEDDYFYIDNAIPKILDFIRKNKNADFVSAYYHPDYDKMKVHKEFNSVKIISDEISWKTAASTTMTFLTTKTILMESEKTFRSYLKNNYDASIWLSLTKHKVKNPCNLFKYMISDSLWSKILLKSWLYSNKQILVGKKKNLYVPVQSLSTHMDTKCLSPSVNWNEKFNSLIEKINFNS